MASQGRGGARSLALPAHHTLILLTSGTTVTWAHHALQVGDRKGARNGLILTVLLGLSFTCVQAYEYREIILEKLFFNPESANAGLYGSSFFMATGFHGFHVLIGTIFLAVCLFRVLAGQFTPKKHFGFEAAAWYWHFVDVVWLFCSPSSTSPCRSCIRRGERAGALACQARVRLCRLRLRHPRVAILIGLGVWQLERKVENVRMLAGIAALQGAPPQPLDAVLRRAADATVWISSACPPPAPPCSTARACGSTA